MLLAAFLQWWYTAGWGQFARTMLAKTHGILDLFSVTTLLGSLFSPFRETFTDRVSGAVDVRLRAWADRQISRLIGAMIRGTVIIFGLIATGLFGIAALICVLLWPFLPVFPAVVAIITMGLGL